MLASTGGGALIGGVAGAFAGGVGAVPGVALGATLGAQLGELILLLMGLKALTEYVVQDMPEISRSYWHGIREAWLAARLTPLPQQPVHVDQPALRHAADTLARAHVAMLVLLLTGIVAYLAKGRGSIGDLAKSVRGGKLGPGFAEWLVRNEGRLKAEPRLRTRTQSGLKSRAISEPVAAGSSGPPRKRVPTRLGDNAHTETPPKERSPATATPLDNFEFRGLKPVQILHGSNGNVAIIGRTMGTESNPGVRDFGHALADEGYKVELFDDATISTDARNQFGNLAREAKQAYQDGQRSSPYLTAEEVKKTAMFKENVAWATKLKSQGYTVVDIGNPYKAESSPFYNAELNIIFGN